MAEREREIRAFLHNRVFDPILDSPHASADLKRGVENTILRMSGFDADDIVRYVHWLVEHGSDTSGSFSEQIRAEGFTCFEDIRHDFDIRFVGRWRRR